MERIIIDTDPGVDDAHAILMAAAHPNTKIEAIMTVGGNVGLVHTTRNAQAIVEVINQDIPIYQGCGDALLLLGEEAAIVHGHDGLGDANIRPKNGKVEAEHASLALIRYANENPNELTLIAIGPLTNIAVALKIDPTLPKKLKRFVVMGGAVTSRGNTSNVSAEFNIFADPEAAHVVFEMWARAECIIELVDWEATVRHKMPEDVVEKFSSMGTPKSDFFREISQTSLNFAQQKYGSRLLFGADPLAMAVTIEPDIVQRAETRYTMVEINGRFTRGQTVVDWRNDLEKQPNTQIILDVDIERFHGLMEAGLV
ncbi:MAG: nucleoside hydrolase [Chloroflexota bacterium]